MVRIVECIPNFSEGRDTGIIESLAEKARQISGVTLLDYSADQNHNRSVFTLAGDPDGIAEAAFRLCELACEKIDMTKHAGGHPRMGATDVIPFVPIKGVDVADCVEISRKVASRVWDELRIPSFLYEESAVKPERKNLAALRKGQFEGMPEKLLQKEWAPDFGNREIHPTAGITAIGARPPLVAFNVNLDTSDLEVAKAVAKTVRGSDGGFEYCKAIGVMLESRDVAQVSMNMVNCDGTPIHQVFEAIRAEAERYGAKITGSEIIGLIPSKALADCAAHYLQIENFSYDRQVLESRLLQIRE